MEDNVQTLAVDCCRSVLALDCISRRKNNISRPKSTFPTLFGI